MLSLQLVRFLAVGAANTLVGLALIYMAKFIGFGDIAANAIGYGLCIGMSFVLNKRWTFRHTGSARSAFIRFIVVVAAAYFANLATVMIAIHALNLNRYFAQALGIPVYTVISYFGSKRFAFSRANSPVDDAVNSPPPEIPEQRPPS